MMSTGSRFGGASCRGLWQRQWEEDPIGDSEGADRDTLVLWTQSSRSGLYVDLRLPPDSPGRSASAAQSRGIQPSPGAIAAAGRNSFPEVVPSSREDLLEALCRHKSFAGVLVRDDGDTTSSGQALACDKILARLAQDAETNENCVVNLCTCFWRRDVDFQPPSGSLDVGVCASEPVREDGSVLLRETGQDGDYAEGWLRLPGTEAGPFLALELVSENGLTGARRGYWVRVGSRFAYAVGRPSTAEAATALGCHPRSHELASCVGQSLADAVAALAGTPQDRLDLVSTYVAVAGEIHNGQWNILYSTHPGLVGCRLLGGSGEEDALCCSTLSSLSSEQVAAGREVIQQLLLPIAEGAAPMTRTWKVVELDGCSLP